MITQIHLPINGLIFGELNENTVDHFIPATDTLENSLVIINLKEVGFVTPYAILVLVMFLRSTVSHGIKIKIILPDSTDVLNYLERISFFVSIENCMVEFDPSPEHLKSNKKHTSSSVIELTAIQKEENVTGIVNELADKLISAHSCKKSSVNRFSEIMIETFQNVTQHTNPSGLPTEGLAAVQVYKNDFQFVIADSGVGIRNSLMTNPRFSKIEMTDTQAIEGVLKKGYTRIDTPGRGGGLQRVQEIAKVMAGEIFIRSNTGLAIIRATDLTKRTVPLVNGTQICVKCPIKVFQDTT